MDCTAASGGSVNGATEQCGGDLWQVKLRVVNSATPHYCTGDSEEIDNVYYGLW